MSQVDTNGLRPIDGYEATDGAFFTDYGAALQYQKRLDFFAWCAQKICVGGEWSSQMVAQEIWANWKVEVRK